MSAEKASMSRVRVLALNGGGVRGLYTISMLAELESVLADGDRSYSIAQHFDLIAGTSIGGLLALGLADGKTARELLEGVKEHAQTIFPPRKRYVPRWMWATWKGVKAALGHRYEAENIGNAIKSIIGKERTIRDLKRRVLIPTVSLTTGKPVMIKTCHNPRFNRDDKLSLVDVALATSAAPTYFQPHFIDEVNAYFVDGGLVANNPCYIAYHEVITDLKDEFPDITDDQIFMLNVGTMSNTFCVNPENIRKRITGYLKLWGIGKNLVEAVMTGNQSMHAFMVKRALPKGNFVQIDDEVPNEQAGIITLDNAGDAALGVLAARGKQRATEAMHEFELQKKFFSTPAKEFIHPKER